MKLGIVIPVHNQVPTFQECLESIVRHFPKGLEQPVRIYVIDNGTTEAFDGWTEACAREGINPLPRISPPPENPSDLRVSLIRHAENIGVTKAWNEGLKAALDDGADVVCISNSDVIYGPRVFERCVEAIEKHGLGACWPLSIQGGPLAANFEERARSQLASQTNVVDTGGFAGWSFFLSRATVEKIGYFDDQFTLWFQDSDYHNRLHAAGIAHGEVRSCLVHHFESKTIRGLSGGFEHLGWRKEDEKRYYKKYPPGK